MGGFRKASLGLFSFFALLSSVAWGRDLQTEALRIEGLLMAPCCWGGTVAEHSSPEALEIKEGVRSMLAEGKTEAQILSLYEAKYGERILARPKGAGFGILVWILPGLILTVGGIFTWVFLRRSRPGAVQTQAAPPGAPADEEYRRRLDRELYGSPKNPA
jgi:cytochrome c-type biogenesis protein CcmH/NrfF